MALSMSRPWKHPDSGFYWFRKRVPDDLRNLVGRREEKFSLGTRDPIEAKRLHALRLAEVEERWSNLRNGQRALSPDDIAREALAIGDHVRRQLEADPYQPLRWDVEIGASLWGVEEADGYYTDITQPLNPAESKSACPAGQVLWTGRRALSCKGACYRVRRPRAFGTRRFAGTAAHCSRSSGLFAWQNGTSAKWRVSSGLASTRNTADIRNHYPQISFGASGQ